MTVNFEALFAASPNPYVLLDTDLAIAGMNEAYLRATMRTRENLLGQPLFQAFPSEPGTESHDLLMSSLRRALETGKVDELALIRYDIAAPDGNMDQRYWSATHTPLHDDGGQVRYILQHTVDVTELESLRRLRDEAGLVQRAGAVQARNSDLLAESGHLRSLFEQAPGFMAVLGGPEHHFQLANAAYRRLAGGREVLGAPMATALPEVVEQGIIALLDKVMQSATPYVGRGEKIMLRSEDGASLEERYLDFVYQPIVHHEGVSGVFVQGHDVTEEAMLMRRQELLINELNHRVKNTLAIVQGLAAQSFRSVDPTGSARATFDSRLQALAAAHDLLTERKWEPTSLRETVANTVAASAGDDARRVHVEGLDVALAPERAVALAMAVHELTTNAIKYGALSVDTGRIDVRWAYTEEQGDAGPLVLDWTERGGPLVQRPRRQGFGTRLIERGLSAEIDGHARIEFDPEGLHCRFVLNLSA